SASAGAQKATRRSGRKREDIEGPLRRACVMSVARQVGRSGGAKAAPLVIDRMDAPRFKKRERDAGLAATRIAFPLFHSPERERSSQRSHAFGSTGCPFARTSK